MEKKTSTDCTPNDIKIVETVSEELANSENIDTVANFLKIISDPTRLKIIMILENHEVSVNDIAVLMNMTKSAVSHQLKVLKNAGYIKDRRSGKNKYYSLFDEHIMVIIHSAYDHVNHC
jgi:ArsR family transcriptional regulator